MAVYTGKVSLINMSNITAAAGVGIERTDVLYAVSNSGTLPPDLTDVELVTVDGVIHVASPGASFQVIDGVLWAQQSGQRVPLKTDKNSVLVGAEEWQTEFPVVQPGDYLWIKTIYYYTNNTQTVTYSVSRQGEDGKEGPAGPAGESSSAYRLDCGQTEILKFVDMDGTTTISPSNLSVSVLKDAPNTSEGYIQITDLNISRFSMEVYVISTGEWLKISDPEIITLGATQVFNINLSKLIEKGDEEGNLAANQILFNECIIKLSYIHTEKNGEKEERFNAIEFLNVRYGMNKDMASLSTKAEGIVASMQDSKMVFNGDGLTIQNGAFKIEKTIKNAEGNNEVIPLLYADELGNLALTGTIYADSGIFGGALNAASGTFSGELVAASGTFSGELAAASGTFKGDISAASGTIGGFRIESNRLVSTDNGTSPSIILDGLTGEIEAKNITLGIGAKIQEYIKIGEQVELRQVGSSGDSFITVLNEGNEILSLKANGTMKVGNGENTIILSGIDGSITSQSYQDGLGWKISNTNSIFNDVTVRGSIRASVLEYGETQAIGGALMVRPSSRILNAVFSGSNTTLTLEEIKGFNVGDYCRIDIQTLNTLGPKYFQIITVNEATKQIIVSGDASGSQGKPIVNFGQEGDNVGISINGSIDNSFSTPQSISVFEFKPDTNQIIPRVVLGKLPNEEGTYGYAAGTYGLYAENVLLKGSLVTQTKTEDSGVMYSGISTVYSGNGVPKSTKLTNKIPSHIPSEILLWAGAKDTDQSSIEGSNFFVDRNGNMYAGSGYFEGTIITNATITASAIETAVLRGSNDKPNEPALKIEDATKGIHFMATNEDGTQTTVFEVTKNSIVANVPNFKFNSNFTVGGNGSLVVPNLYVVGADNGAVIADEVVSEAFMFDKHRISYTKDFKQNELTGSVNGYIEFINIKEENEEIEKTHTIFSPDGVNQVVDLSGQEVRAKRSLYLEDSIKYNNKMEYKPVYDEAGDLIGYDLYIE